MTFRMGENETEIDFVLIKKQTLFAKCEGYPWEFHHTSVVADIGKRKIKNAFRKTCTERRKISLLKGLRMRKRFKEKVTTLVDNGAPNLWGHLKDMVLETCVEVCWKKRWQRSKGDTWWWNEEVKGVVSRKEEVHKAMCPNSTEENKRRYNSMKNKALSKAMREKAEDVLTDLQN